MTSRIRWSIAIMAAAAMMPATLAFAQERGGFGPPPPDGGNRPVTVADTPLDTLTSALSLTASQQSQISAIQLTTHETIRDLLPQRQGGGPQGFGPGPSQNSQAGGPDQGGNGQGGPGGPGGPFGQGGPNDQNGPGSPGGFGPGDGWQPTPLDATTRTKIDTVEASATSQIDAVLTPAQLTSLNSLMDQLKDLQTVGISPRLYTKLQLTDSELSQIRTIAAASKDTVKTALLAAATSGDYNSVADAIQTSRQNAQKRVIALLTPSQAQIVQADSQGQRGQGRNFGGPGGQNGQFGGLGPGSNNAGGPPQGVGPQDDQAGGPPPQQPGDNGGSS